MSMASNYLEESVLNYFFRNQTVARPSQLFLALYINDPTETDTGTEVSGTGYVRKEVLFGVPEQNGTKGTIKNTNKIEFPIAGNDWGAVSHWAIKDSATGGHMLCYGAFSRVENVNKGNRFVVETANLTISVD